VIQRYRTVLRPALAAALAFGAAWASSAQAGDISGAGATFPYPVYAKWADAYKKEYGVGMNYQSIGSGGGIKQIEAKTVTFGASDKPLTADELQKNDLLQWPQIMGGVVPVINVKGIGPGVLRLDGPTLAKIYLGQITDWDDAAIKKLNPEVDLPGTAIAVVHRADSSGTSFLFTTYLSAVSPDWKSKVGANTAVDWPVGIGAKGNEAVASMTLQTDGGIGYVEYAYVVQNNMSYARLVNAAGKVVIPSSASFQAAADNADWAHAKGFYQVLVNQPGAESWPITGASFILVHGRNDDAASVLAALKFFHWAFQNGGDMAEQLRYVPLPKSVSSLVEASWSQVKDASGKPIWKK
jgi:phosphate transport system substrate-binding protein